MPLNVFRNGILHHYILDDYRDGCFTMKSDQDSDSISVMTPLKLDDRFKDKEFEIIFLAKKDVKEQEIIEVISSVRDERIGLLIPVNALCSKEHTFSEKTYFLSYAYATVRKILSSSLEDLFTKELVEDKSEVLLSDIFHEYTVFLIISKEKLAPGEEIDIDRIIPSLIKYGYTKLGNNSPSAVELYVEISQLKKITLYPVSREINNCQLISSILCNAFITEKKNVTRFFYLYQIFEILIEYIYECEQKSLVDKVVEVMGDVNSTKDALSKLQEFTAEKKRLTLLISYYSQIEGTLGELQKSCLAFLKFVNRTTKEIFQEYFYGVRNFLFHQYHNYPSDAEEILSSIILETLNILPILLHKIKPPIR